MKTEHILANDYIDGVIKGYKAHITETENIIKWAQSHIRVMESIIKVAEEQRLKLK